MPEEPNPEIVTADPVPEKIPYSEYQPLRHFLILYILSVGIYLFFWFYKHLRYLRDEKKEDISPGFRSLLLLFFAYPMFVTFKRLANEKGAGVKTPVLLLYCLFLGLAMFTFLKNETTSALSFLVFIPLIPIVNMMNNYYKLEQSHLQFRTRLAIDEVIFLVLVWIFIFYLAFAA